MEEIQEVFAEFEERGLMLLDGTLGLALALPAVGGRLGRRQRLAILPPMRFHGTVKLAGKTATGIQVPPEVVTGLDAGKRPPVRVTINGHAYRTSVAPMGGVFMLPVSAEQRVAAGVAAGDEVDIDIELDTEPREVTVPQDLGDALDGDPQARSFFDGLSYSNRLRHVLSIEGAKTAETRLRRIAKVVGQMHEGRP